MKTTIAALLVSLLPMTAAADALLEYRLQGDGKAHSAIRVADGRVMVDQDGGSDEMLYLREGDRMYIINHSKRRYALLDEEAMSRVSGQVNDAMKQMEEQLANMPPEAREQMKRMMGGMMDMGKKMMEPEIERSGKKGEFNGMSCDYLTLTIPGVTSSEMCVAKTQELAVSGDDRATLDRMNAHLERISKAMSESLGMNIPFNLVGGMPIFIRDDDTPGGRVLHVNAGADVGSLDLPDGYREVRLEDMAD